ncbi:MAG: hypothetical protein WD768_16085 [Phycisphaeraceae bacterium]
MDDNSTGNLKKRRITPVGIAGLIVALIALVGAVMSPWIIEHLEPEPRPVDEVVADAAVKIKERISANLKGEKYIAPSSATEKGLNWSKVYPATVVGVAALAICIGVFGFVRANDRRLNVTTVGVGAAAIVFQYVILISAAILFILFVVAILSVLGGDLPVDGPC